MVGFEGNAPKYFPTSQVPQALLTSFLLCKSPISLTLASVLSG